MGRCAQVLATSEDSQETVVYNRADPIYRSLDAAVHSAGFEGSEIPAWLQDAAGAFNRPVRLRERQFRQRRPVRAQVAAAKTGGLVRSAATVIPISGCVSISLLDMVQALPYT